MNITVVGAGRVGLANATFLTMRPENDVTIVDQDPQIIRRLKIKDNIFGVPWFDHLFNFRTHFQTSPDDDPGDMILFCIPWSDSFLDTILSYIDYEVPIIIRSSLSPGHVYEIRNVLQDRPTPKMALFPEFLVEGKESEGVWLSRDQYIGAFEKEHLAEIKEIISSCYQLGTEGLYSVDNPETAAAIKIGTNMALAMKVTTANIIRDQWEDTEVDLETAMQCIEEDPRLGSGYFKPGIGYGGSCLPWAIEQFNHSVIEAVAEYNEHEIITNHLDKIEKWPVLFFGYNFKGGVQDFRNSNQLNLINSAAVLNDRVYVSDDHFDPVVEKWWTPDPINIIGEIGTIVIFYATKKLREIERYLNGEPLKSDLETWNNIPKIDFR